MRNAVEIGDFEECSRVPRRDANRLETSKRTHSWPKRPSTGFEHAIAHQRQLIWQRN
jgi:hypothetical protein